MRSGNKGIVLGSHGFLLGGYIFMMFMNSLEVIRIGLSEYIAKK